VRTYIKEVRYIIDGENVRIMICKHVLYLHLESCMHLFSSREPLKGIQGHVGQPPTLKLKLKLGRTVLSFSFDLKDVYVSITVLQ
jgi:hypothetical protein